MKSKASFCGTKATRTNGEPVQAKPCGRALPGLDRTSDFAFCSTHAKRSQTQNRTFHLLFKPDILTCYEQKRTEISRSRSVVRASSNQRYSYRQAKRQTRTRSRETGARRPRCFLSAAE